MDPELKQLIGTPWDDAPTEPEPDEDPESPWQLDDDEDLPF